MPPCRRGKEGCGCGTSASVPPRVLGKRVQILRSAALPPTLRGVPPRARHHAERPPEERLPCSRSAKGGGTTGFCYYGPLQRASQPWGATKGPGRLGEERDGWCKTRPTDIYITQGSERLKSFSERSQNCVLCDYVYGCMRHTHSSIIYLLDRVCSQLHLALVASATRAGARLVHEARVGFALPRIRLRTVRCRWLVSAVLVVGWCGGWWQRQHAEAHPFLAARVQVGAELRG